MIIMLFVDDKGGDIYIWIDKHCYDYVILASPREIWTCAKVCIMPWVDMLSCEENAKTCYYISNVCIM